ncbi:glycosyltransferase family 4 protein [bacterium]|nr:glycosyltransferase family 4 protein [bacterium]
MKVAFVVQRYGLEINGGAELHCRWVAEHMKKHWDLEVLTTRAFDYITWKNHYPRGEEEINGVSVRRFSLDKTRNPRKFGRIQEHIMHREHRLEEELEWMEEQGPLSSSLIDYIKTHQKEYDYFIFFSYRYYHSYWGIHSVPSKSILVPTAEHDPVIHFHIFKELFRKPQAFIYNSVEEKNLINRISHNEKILGDVVGVGTELPSQYSGETFRKKYSIDGDYIIYMGRIDKNKGCDQLFKYFLQFKRDTGSDVKLILVGNSVLKIPSHPDVVYLGFLSEEDKFSALSEALLLVMPSFYESLSMVTLESWALGHPVLANAECEVLRGQCLRSQAGLYYENYDEFKEALNLLLSRHKLRLEMGKKGRSYFLKNYTWKVIENKYLNILGQLEKRK